MPQALGGGLQDSSCTKTRRKSCRIYVKGYQSKPLFQALQMLNDPDFEATL